MKAHPPTQKQPPVTVTITSENPDEIKVRISLTFQADQSDARYVLDELDQAVEELRRSWLKPERD